MPIEKLFPRLHPLETKRQLLVVSRNYQNTWLLPSGSVVSVLERSYDAYNKIITWHCQVLTIPAEFVRSEYHFQPRQEFSISDTKAQEHFFPYRGKRAYYKTR